VLLAALALSALGSLILAGAAFADFFTPESGGSPNADQIDSLYKLILYVAIVVFIIVEGALAYSLFKFRAKRSKGRQAAQIHGNTNLEIGWTVAAALILVVLTVVTFVKLGDIQHPPASDPGAATGTILTASTTPPKVPGGKKLWVCVIGRQYIWRYSYTQNCSESFKPGAKPVVFSYQEMVVPVGVTVVLEIRANDVIHSWWIPRLGGKFDAVPGKTNYTWFKIPADQAGTVFTGQCAELCGRNHADMTARVKALTPDAFQGWLVQQQHYIAQAQQNVPVLKKQLEKSGDL
jgi:cytochrome c oxidase subunit 2